MTTTNMRLGEIRHYPFDNPNIYREKSRELSPRAAGRILGRLRPAYTVVVDGSNSAMVEEVLNQESGRYLSNKAYICVKEAAHDAPGIVLNLHNGYILVFLERYTTAWKLYLDDLRVPKDETYVVARTTGEARRLIEERGMPGYVSFDHDLGIDEQGNLLESGYDFAKWLVEMDMDGKLQIPEGFDFNVHSANPVGAKNIGSYLEGYLKTKYTNQKITTGDRA